MTQFQPGDRFLVRWGSGKVPGTVLSLFPGNFFARLVIEIPSDEDEPSYQSLTLPVDLLEPIPRTDKRAG